MRFDSILILELNHISKSIYVYHFLAGARKAEQSGWNPLFKIALTLLAHLSTVSLRVSATLAAINTPPVFSRGQRDFLTNLCHDKDYLRYTGKN
jgi:hypothetical protein